jgi:hypothetical protein
MPARRSSWAAESTVPLPDDPEIVYTVEEGDDLDHIVGHYADLGVTVEDIFANNENIKGDEDLVPGEEVTVAVLVGDRAANPDHNLFVVTPFIRAAATDLNLTGAGFDLILPSSISASQPRARIISRNSSISALGNPRRS